jgi:hypothetical protein
VFKGHTPPQGRQNHYTVKEEIRCVAQIMNEPSIELHCHYKVRAPLSHDGKR